jgi:hypothetical protein
MLEGLDNIDWSKLSHAYGEANDVPDLLRALASKEEAKRLEAQNELYGNLWHQGTVYEASAYAVPFFIELLTSPNVKNKGFILSYLESLAGGSSYLEAHHVFDDPEDVASPEYQEQWQSELHWVKATREAVAQGSTIYIHFLCQGEVNERTASALLLSALLPDRPESVNELLKRLELEDAPIVQTALLMSFALLTQPSAELLIKLESYLRSPDPLLRYGSAYSLARLKKSQVSTTVLEVLRDSLVMTERLGNDLAVLPRNFSPDELVNEVCRSFEYIGKSALPYFLQALQQLGTGERYYKYYLEDMAGSLFCIAFDRQPFDMDASINLAQLDEEQRKVLTALATYKDVIDKVPHNLEDLKKLLAEQLKHGEP